MGKFYSILILFTCIAQFTAAQDWRSPIDFPIRLSGTFCELRTNHFHHGIDIKSSKGVSGDQIYSIGEGTIHRLRVQAAGYGNSIYIKHPDGYVSVYGHLLNFSPKLDSIVKKFQYQQESYEIDIYCDSLQVGVSKGEKIARMGSTGFSFGPHLHFEIRDEKTEVTINPLHFGFEIEDHVKPKFSQIRIDYLTPEGRKYGEKTFPIYAGKSKKYIKGDTIHAPAWRIGLALRTQDKMDNTHNQNGIYKATVRVDSQLVYRFVGDSVHFNESRGVNVIKDVISYARKKERWYLAYDMPGNSVGDYIISSKDLGWIKPFAGKPQMVNVTIEDFNQNKSELEFFILRAEDMVEQNFPSYNYKLLHSEPNIIRHDKFELSCPEDAFYRDQYIHVEELSEDSEGALSNVIQLSGEELPFHRSCTMKIKPRTEDSMQLAHAVVLKCKKESFDYVGGRYENGFVQWPMSSFGEYVVYADFKKPNFEVSRFAASAKNGDSFRFKIYDEYESKGSAAEAKATAKIDSRWVLLAHDVKTNTFALELTNLSKGSHELHIQYEDAVGNQGEWKKSFNIIK